MDGLKKDEQKDKDEQKIIDEKINEIDGMLDSVIEKLDQILNIVPEEQDGKAKYKNSYHKKKAKRANKRFVDESIRDVHKLISSVRINAENVVGEIDSIKETLKEDNEVHTKELITSEIRQRVEDIREREKQRKRRKSSVRGPTTQRGNQSNETTDVVKGRTLTCTGGKNVLLQLQRLPVKTKSEEKQYVNTLWDAGSTISFITFRRAAELNLRETKDVFLEIENIGETKQGFKTKIFELELIDKNGNIEILHVLGIERILTNVKGINYNELYAKFTGIQNGQIEGPNKGEVHCLIGYDYAGLHPVRKRVCGHLLVLENTFGTIVAGLSSVGNLT